MLLTRRVIIRHSHLKLRKFLGSSALNVNHQLAWGEVQFSGPCSPLAIEPSLGRSQVRYHSRWLRLTKFVDFFIRNDRRPIH
jgi:hypothetical protein